MSGQALLRHLPAAASCKLISLIGEEAQQQVGVLTSAIANWAPVFIPVPLSKKNDIRGILTQRNQKNVTQRFSHSSYSHSSLRHRLFTPRSMAISPQWTTRLLVTRLLNSKHRPLRLPPLYRNRLLAPRPDQTPRIVPDEGFLGWGRMGEQMDPTKGALQPQ